MPRPPAGVEPGPGAGQVDHRRGPDLVREPTWLATNTGWGSYRATFPPIITDDFVARLMWMPPGQQSPWHGSGGWPEMGQPFPALGDGSIFLNLEGEVSFRAGGAAFDLEPGDVLLVNAVVYSYRTGLDHSLFWTVQPRRDRPGPVAPGPVWEGDPRATAMSGSHPYYDTEPPPAPDALDRMSAVHWADHRREEIDWRGDWGGRWGTYPTIEAGVRGRVLRVPAGQRTDPGAVDHDTLLLGLGSEPMEVVVAGAHHPLAGRDALLVPAGMACSYLNPGLSDVLCFEVRPRAGSTSDGSKGGS